MAITVPFFISTEILNENCNSMSDAKFGTFEDFLAITPEQLQTIATKLKEIVISLDPDTCEVVRLGDRAATYGVGPKKMSEGYVYILPYNSWVNLGFYKGADLEHPNKLLEGTGKKLRHIKMRSLEEVNRSEVRDLIIAAIEERKKAFL